VLLLDRSTTLAVLEVRPARGAVRAADVRIRALAELRPTPEPAG
jgi:hypothetical protein